MGSVFRKMLKMDTASSTYSSGQLTNLMSVDAQSVLEYSCYTHFIWATSLQVIVNCRLLHLLPYLFVCRGTIGPLPHVDVTLYSYSPHFFCSGPFE